MVEMLANNLVGLSDPTSYVLTFSKVKISFTVKLSPDDDQEAIDVSHWSIM
jgi:hypothetical protein